MITYVAELLNLFAMTLASAFQVSWFFGKVIVDALTGISLAIFKVVISVLTFFQIIYEDNITIFNEELPRFAGNVMNTINAQLVNLQISVLNIYYDFCSKIYVFTVFAKWLINAVLIVLCEIVHLFKNTVILLGNTLWFILTFIPVQLPLLLKALIKNLTDVMVKGVVNVYMGLLKVTNFLTDVPLQSFIGILSTIVIVRLCVHFRESIRSQVITLYWCLLRNLRYYYYVFNNYFIDPDIREITRLSGGQVITVSDNPSQIAVVDDGSAADALCVICQEHQKCVLTLPCRHICLCTECCMRLYGYQRTCPICRTFIYHSVTVYL